MLVAFFTFFAKFVFVIQYFRGFFYKFTNHLCLASVQFTRDGAFNHTKTILFHERE